MTRGPLLVLAGGRSQVPLVQRAVELGLAPWVFDRDPQAPAAAHAARFDAVSAHDPEAILVRVRERAEVPPVGVVSSSSAPDAQFAAAVVARALALPGPDPDVLHRVLDKGAQTSVLVTARIPHPKSVLAFGAEEAAAAARRLRRSVLKPAARASSDGPAGIGFVEAGDRDVERRAATAVAAGDGRVLVQEIVQGELYSLAGFALADGVRPLCIARKQVEGSPPLPRGLAVEPREHAPAEERRRHSQLVDLAGVLVRAFDLVNTAFDVEFAWTQDGPVVLELGLQLDAQVDRLLDHAGCDVYGALCALALGEAPRELPPPERAAATRFLYAPIPLDLGRAAVRAAERTASSAGARVEWNAPPGTRILPPRSHSDALGWVSSHGRDADEAIARAREVAERIVAGLMA